MVEMEKRMKKPKLLRCWRPDNQHGFRILSEKFVGSFWDGKKGLLVPKYSSRILYPSIAIPASSDPRLAYEVDDLKRLLHDHEGVEAKWQPIIVEPYAGEAVENLAPECVKQLQFRYMNGAFHVVEFRDSDFIARNIGSGDWRGEFYRLPLPDYLFYHDPILEYAPVS